MSEELRLCPECGSRLNYLPMSMRGVHNKEEYGKCWCWKCFKQLHGRDTNVSTNNKESEVKDEFKQKGDTMSAINYQCSLCKETYDMEIKAAMCFSKCSKVQKKKEEVEKKKVEDWFKEHPPLFKKGDLVRFKRHVEVQQLGFCNRFFVVREVVKSTDMFFFGKPCWLYSGITGEYNPDYGTCEETEIQECKEIYLELCMEESEYNKATDAIVKRAKAVFPEASTFFVDHSKDTEELKLSVYLPIKEKP